MEEKSGVQWNMRTGLHTGKPRALPVEGGTRGDRVRLLLLTCLGGGCAMLAFVTAFALPVDGWVVLLATWGLVAALTGLFSLRRAAVPVLLAGMLLWVALGWWLWDDLVLGLLKTADIMFELFASHSSFTFVDLGAAVNYMSYDLAVRRVTLFFLMALVPWTVLFTWAGVEQGGVVLSAVLTLPFAVVPLWFYIQPARPALMGLLLYWGALAFGRLVPRWDRRSAGRVGLFALPALALGLLALYAVTPPADYVRPPEMEVVRVRAEDWLKRLPGLLTPEEGIGTALPGGGFLSKDQQRRSFDNLGFARFTGRTALRVKVEGGSTLPLYLKGYTGGVYTADGWERLGAEAEAALAAASYPVDPQNLTANRHAFSYPIKTLSVINQANARAIYVPPGLVTTPNQFALAEFVGDGNIRARGLLGLDQYSVDYLAEPNNVLIDGTEEFDRYQAAAYAHYTGVPPELEGVLQQVLGRVPTLDSSFPTGMEPYQVQALLKDLGSYTLTPGSPPAGQDFTEYFLAENQQGFCVHFATAGVLLLRQLGVPARYCEGYLVTPSDLRLKGSDGFSNVSDRRAHAWVEYWSNDVGWMTLECTPGFAPQADLVPPNDATNETEATPRPSEKPEPTPVPTPKPSATPKPEPQEPAGEEHPTTAALVAFLKVAIWPFLAVLAVLTRRRVMLYLRKNAFAQPDRNGAALAIYLAADRLTPYAGEMDEALTTLAQKARFSQHTLTDEELATLLEAWYVRQDAALTGAGAVKKLWLVWILCLEETTRAEA